MPHMIHVMIGVVLASAVPESGATASVVGCSIATNPSSHRAQMSTSFVDAN